jgi:hypothetical protein
MILEIPQNLKNETSAAKATFRIAAHQYHAENEAAWKSKIYRRQWLASLENYAFPKLGDVPIGGIVTADIPQDRLITAGAVHIARGDVSACVILRHQIITVIVEAGGAR